MGEIALYVKGKMPTTYEVLGLGYGGGLVEVSAAGRDIFTAMEFIVCFVFFG